MGDLSNATGLRDLATANIDTFAGKVEVVFERDAACTPHGQLPFFIDFLKTTGVYDALLDDCPLDYTSPNAPSVRDVLGTLTLSILSGHRRYAHINGLRHDGVNPELLGMSKVLSEDAIRRAVAALATPSGFEWLERHLRRCTEPLSARPWIMDVDASVKPLYGRQEGAVPGYNPKKPGRPCHALHSAMMAGTRMAMSVEMRAGNEGASRHALDWLGAWLDATPRAHWPALLRGDVGLGTDAMMTHCETRALPYLFKLRRSAGVKRLAEKLSRQGEWRDCGAGWSAAESRLKLLGWEKERRVIVMRRVVRHDLKVKGAQGELEFIDCGDGERVWEYAVLVTDLALEPWALTQLYRERADCENHFDELKNQWGWGGFVTQDLARSRLMTRLIALLYNWWTLYARIAGDGRHQEALTSRPELLHGVGRMSKHAGGRVLRVSSLHAAGGRVLARLRLLSRLLRQMTAEQLSLARRWSALLTLAFRKLLPRIALLPAVSTA